MKKTLSTLLVLGLIFAALTAAPAEAKKKKPKRTERKVALAYQFGSPGIPGAVGVCLAAFVEGSACINTPTGPTEKFVSVEVDDASGQTPHGILAQDTDPDRPGFEIFATFCGATEAPVALPAPGAELRVSLYMAPSPATGCVGITTSGTINATLSNMP